MMMTLSLTPRTLTSRGHGLLAEFSFATSFSCFLAPLKRPVAEPGQYRLRIGCSMLTMAIKVAQDRPGMNNLQTTLLVVWSTIGGPAPNSQRFQGCSQPLSFLER